MKTEWPPSDDAFQAFLAWLSPDREEAGQRFEAFKQKFVRFFIHGGCHVPDEMFYETVARAANKIHSGKVDRSDDPTPYCHGVARRVLSEYHREPIPGELQEDFQDRDTVPDWNEDEMQCLDQCLSRLNEHHRDLVSRFFLYKGRKKIELHKEMAAQEGGSAALRVKVFRIKKTLRECVADCISHSRGELSH